MDGYTAYGASITANGSKQTFNCPAPQVVLADLDVIAAAPAKLNAAGYADLLAKIPAGADWILADAAGVEPIDAGAWETVQGRLHAWIEDPVAIVRRDAARLRQLTCGLMMSGFAMQAARSSRPASGAEHQFSHLWDMQHHTHAGAAPSHGFKVGIGTLASIALYEELLAGGLERQDIESAIKKWPTREKLEEQIASQFEPGELRDVATREMRGKYPSAQALGDQLGRLVQAWPDLMARLQRQLLPFHRVRDLLNDAGCPTQSEQIGISHDRLRLSYLQALHIRRRFTVLDMAHRAGLLDESLGRLFAPGGPWATSAKEK
jgi:glycerol-1-phosphate dehydrogenase [NAD(P)+]